MRIRQLQRAFDSPPHYGKNSDWGYHIDYTLYDIANLLLRYLMQLPELVIPAESYAKFHAPLEEYRSERLA